MNFIKSILIILVLSVYLKANSQSELMSKGDEEYLETNGDLDKDSIDEKVIVYKLKNPVYKVDSQTRDTTKFEYELVIFKFVDKKWVIWQRSINAVFEIESYIRDSNQINNDQVFDINIQKGILIISYGQGIGGNNTRSDYVYKFRFQNNEFQLIGYTSSGGQFARGCTFEDCNLSTGKIEVSEQIADYANTNSESNEKIISNKHEIFYYKFKEKVNLQNIYEKSIRIVSPKYKLQINI